MFHCRNPYWECNWQGDVDHVAAMNIASRIKDREINRFTPYREVKKILEERFLRRLESRGIPTDDAATAQRLRLQAYHDNPSWTWEVVNHRLALVLSLWIGQNTQRRLESEDKRGAYRCICISERHSHHVGSWSLPDSASNLPLGCTGAFLEELGYPHTHGRIHADGKGDAGSAET